MSRKKSRGKILAYEDRRRPDGLKAWVVAFDNFLINFIVVGLGRMSGILYIAFMKMFHINRQAASMPFSIQQAARTFFGPLSGIAGQKYGIRCVTVIGGIIGTLSAFTCYFVMDITWITVLWGFMFGVCTALTTTLNQIPIDQYFEKHRTTAGGLAFSGGCVAAFIFPVILETLISSYGMAETFLFMAALIFLVIPAATLLVEPPWHKKCSKESLETMSALLAEQSEKRGWSKKLADNNRALQSDTELRNDNATMSTLLAEDSQSEKRGWSKKLADHNRALQSDTGLRNDNATMSTLLAEDSQSEKRGWLKKLADHSIALQSEIGLRNDRTSNPSGEQSNSILQHLKTAAKLHASPIFLLICLCRGVFMLTFIPLVTIIVDFAMDKGLEQNTGKYLIPVLSLGDLLGRLCLGWINDSGLVSLPRYMLVTMLLLACSTATLPLMRGELSLIPAILIFGMLEGSLFVRHQNLVSMYMEEHEQAIGMGFINFLSGFIGFALPFYIGYFRDVQGSYDGMFYLNAGICALIGSLWIFLEPPFLARRSEYEKIMEV